MSKKLAQVASGRAKALNVMHQAYIWHKYIYEFHFCADSMLCLPRLHPSIRRRRQLEASSEDVMEDPCDRLFQICDANVAIFLVFDEFSTNLPGRQMAKFV